MVAGHTRRPPSEQTPGPPALRQSAHMRKSSAEAGGKAGRPGGQAPPGAPGLGRHRHLHYLRHPASCPPTHRCLRSVGSTANCAHSCGTQAHKQSRGQPLPAAAPACSAALQLRAWTRRGIAHRVLQRETSTCFYGGRMRALVRLCRSELEMGAVFTASCCDAWSRPSAWTEAAT